MKQVQFLHLPSLLCFILLVNVLAAVARRDERTLFGNLFNRPSGPCISLSNRTGVCSSASECSARHGVEDGFCSRPYGVCCILLVSCESSTNAMTSYFVNPEYPEVTSEARRCRILLEIFDESICQIRLDFEQFQVAPPHQGECEDDFFFIDGMDEDLPRLCGNNDRQHIFLHVEKMRGPITAMVITSGKTQTRRWSIKITQLPCSSSLLAPRGCMQFFPETTGVLKSFNYDDHVPERRGYFNNYDYAMCLQRSPGFCAIKFEAQETDLDIGEISAGNETCSGDFLQFQLALSKPGSLTNRLCRSSYFGQLATSGPVVFKGAIAGPPVVYFFSDGIGTQPAGFKIAYALTPC